MVYKRVRGWTSEWSLPELNFVEYPPPLMTGQDSAQGMWYKFIIQVSWQEGGSGLLPFERGVICSVSFRALNWRFWYPLGGLASLLEATLFKGKHSMTALLLQLINYFSSCLVLWSKKLYFRDQIKQEPHPDWMPNKQQQQQQQKFIDKQIIS